MVQDGSSRARWDETHLVVGEATRGEPMADALVAVDPVLHRLQEAPYDEVAAAAGGGRLIGLSARTTVLRGWMRPIGYLVSFALLAFLAISIDIAVTELWLDAGREPAGLNILMSSLISLPLGFAGALMLWRLLMTRGQTSQTADEINESHHSSN